jgi:hypothetical protein
MFVKVVDVGASTNKPQEFMQHYFKGHFLGSEQGEALTHVKMNLDAKQRLEIVDAT